MTDHPAGALDQRLLLLAEADNVVVARMAIAAGTILQIGGCAVALAADAPVGFKIARCDIEPGEKVMKYGAPIGSASSKVRCGDIVHTHNLQSDYLPTYTLEDERTFVRRTDK